MRQRICSPVETGKDPPGWGDLGVCCNGCAGWREDYALSTALFFRGQRSRFRMRVKLDTEPRRPNTTADMSVRISSTLSCDAARRVFCKAPAEGTKTFIFL